MPHAAEADSSNLKPIIMKQDMKIHDSTKYLIRSIKYFFYFAIIVALMVGALILVGAVEGNIDTIFRGGWNSIWKMAILFAVVAAIYPKLGFIKREAITTKPWAEVRQEVIDLFKERNYIRESEDATQITFRYKNVAGRISKMFEDRITVNADKDGVVELEGLRKDVMRLSMGIENRFIS